MATIKPFAALRPKPELAARICELPYDVMSSDEAREMARGTDLSFLHVSKPEIDLPPTTDIYDPAVYAKGRENFQKLISSGALKQDTAPAFYLYRQIMGGHTQLGLVAARNRAGRGAGEAMCPVRFPLRAADAAESRPRRRQVGGGVRLDLPGGEIRRRRRRVVRRRRRRQPQVPRIVLHALRLVDAARPTWDPGDSCWSWRDFTPD